MLIPGVPEGLIDTCERFLGPPFCFSEGEAEVGGCQAEEDIIIYPIHFAFATARTKGPTSLWLRGHPTMSTCQHVNEFI
eukprot:g30158.t1